MTPLNDNFDRWVVHCFLKNWIKQQVVQNIWKKNCTKLKHYLNFPLGDHLSVILSNKCHSIFRFLAECVVNIRIRCDCMLLHVSNHEDFPSHLRTVYLYGRYLGLCLLTHLSMRESDTFHFHWKKCSYIMVFHGLTVINLNLFFKRKYICFQF